MSMVERQALARLIAGFTVWAVGFMLIYGLQAMGCAYEWPAHRAILTIAYIAVLIPLAWLALHPHKSQDEQEAILSRSALWANRAALVCAILIFLPVTFASSCM